MKTAGACIISNESTLPDCVTRRQLWRLRIFTEKWPLPVEGIGESRGSKERYTSMRTAFIE